MLTPPVAVYCLLMAVWVFRVGLRRYESTGHQEGRAADGIRDPTNGPLSHPRHDPHRAPPRSASARLEFVSWGW